MGQDRYLTMAAMLMGKDFGKYLPVRVSAGSGTLVFQILSLAPFPDQILLSLAPWELDSRSWIIWILPDIEPLRIQIIHRIQRYVDH